MSAAQGQLRLTALLACCVGVVLGWQLCLFPPGQASPLVGTFLDVGQTAALNVTVVLANALGAGAFLALFPKMLSPALPSGCSVFAALTQTLAFAALALLPGTPAALGAGLLLGLSVTAWWCALTLFIARLDVEMAEKTFVFALPLCGAGALLPRLAGPLAAVPLACLAAPAAALALLFLAARTADTGCGVAEKSTWGTERPERADLMPATRLGGTLMQALAAYLCISLCRPDNPLLRAQAAPSGLAACALGFAAGGLMLWLFTVRTPRVDVFASVRLVFPVLALGIACSVSDAVPTALAGVCLLSTCHAVLECSIRLNILSLVRDAGKQNTAILALGLAIIGLGSVVGVAGNGLVGLLGISATGHALLCLPFLMAIVVTVFMGPRPQAAEPRDAAAERVPQHAPPLDICGTMAAKYQLTARETEVLGYLLQGRSHPFIRDQLGISKGTVDTHVRHIYAKVGVSRKQELLSLAAEERARPQSS